MKPTGILISLLAGVALCTARQAPTLDDIIAKKLTAGHNRHAVNGIHDEGLRRILFEENGSSHSSSSMKNFKAMRQSKLVSSFLQQRRTQTSVVNPSRAVSFPKFNEGKIGGKGNRKAAGKGMKAPAVGGKGSRPVSGGKASYGKASKNSSKGTTKASSKSSKKQIDLCRDFTFTDHRRLQNKGEDCSPNILDVASKNPDLSIFVDLIERAGLEDVFNCAGKKQLALSEASVLFCCL